jgi:hypothetical protein
MTQDQDSHKTSPDTGGRPRHRGIVSPEARKKKVPLGFDPSLPPDLAQASGTGSSPNLRYQGGPVINTPQVYLLFVGDWTSAANQTRATRLGQYMTDLLNSRYMNILSQYGCGTTGTLVNSVFVAAPDNDLSNAEIHGILQNAINANAVPEPGTTLQNAYIMILDDATGVNDAVTGAVMCEPTSDTAFGYHDSFTTTAGHTCIFAVVPGLTNACLQNSCPGSDGSCSLHLAQTQEQRQTQVISHEFSEMISNPLVGTANEAWSAGNNPEPHENGDICNGQTGTITVGPNTWTVQLMYSKWHDMNTNGAVTCIADSDPLPSLLPACTIVLDRSTFGKDEVDALLTLSNPAQVAAAFYVIVDGFTPPQLNITAATLTNPPNIVTFPAVAGMTVTPTSIIPEDPTLGGGIQRFTWVYRVNFTNSTGFPTSVGGVTSVTLSASVTAGGTPAISASGNAVMQLIHEPNPYELDGPVSWLSTDVRVFQINEGQSRFGAAMGNSAADAITFIQQVLTNLNSGSSGGQTFDDILTDENASVLELSETVNGTRVFNFAVAKVRYRALLGDAPNVRVFFRTFPAMTTSTQYDQTTTYRRAVSGATTIPLLGIAGSEVATIPYFATARVDTTAVSMTTQLDPTNVRTIVHDGSGNEVSTYFGCWLDINQAAEARFPVNPSPADGPYAGSLKTIQELVRNIHQCLVAEIAFDPDPISNAASPGSSDKLAQRNLSVVASDNPGSPASHMIPNTFEVRWTPLTLPHSETPDELLIDWTALPAGSDATLYLPGASASQILSQANQMYVSSRIQLVDEHTLKFEASGLSYVPVPKGSGANLPGLLTVNLPPTVRKGQAFKVVVRQVTNASAKQTPLPPPIGSPTRSGMKGVVSPLAQTFDVIRWRQILGSFQISIPVGTKDVLLGPEERLLAVLRWILLAIPLTNRWYPVFSRYVEQVADRVRALGGDPDTIEPSPGGGGNGKPPGLTRRCCLPAWLAAAALALFIITLGLVAGAPGRWLSILLGLLFLVALLLWQGYCRPTFCASVSPLLLGLAVGIGVLGLLILLGAAVATAPLQLAAWAIVLALIILLGVARGCLPFCRKG